MKRNATKTEMKLNPTQRTNAIGQLQTHIQVGQVAHAFHVHPKTITSIIERYRQAGSIKD